MFTAAIVSLEVFALVATVDGIYFHLLKYRLFARPESRYEHRLHTIHAILFPVLVVMLFLRQLSGVLLWLAVAIVAIDFTVQMLDVICERRSRATIGGLSTAEYAVHVVAVTSRVAAFTLALASRPAAAWSLSPSLVREAPIPPFAQTACWLVVAGAVAVAALHLWLVRWPDEAAV